MCTHRDMGFTPRSNGCQLTRQKREFPFRFTFGPRIVLITPTCIVIFTVPADETTADVHRDLLAILPEYAVLFMRQEPRPPSIVLEVRPIGMLPLRYLSGDY